MAAARIEVQRARARLLETVDALERPITHFLQQLTPTHIMREAWDGAKEKGADIAEDAVDAVKARPLAATGVAAAIAMFLARGPLMDLAGRLVSSKPKSKSKPKPKPKTGTRRKPALSKAEGAPPKPENMEAIDDR
jgi:hypothetical protein